MLAKIVRYAMSAGNTKITKLPKAPSMLSGELESYRFDAEHARIYDGYTLD